MIIAKIIIYISVFVWLFPPLRQFRGRFFYFFLVLALGDPIAIPLMYNNLIPASVLHLAISTTSFFSLPQMNRHLKRVYLIPVLAIIFAFAVLLAKEDLILLIGIVHFFILYAILQHTINHLSSTGRIQFFHLLLIIYELSVLLKFINKIFTLNSGMAEFYFTTGFQIIIGILFCFIKEESPKFSLRFGKP